MKVAVELAVADLNSGRFASAGVNTLSAYEVQLDTRNAMYTTTQSAMETTDLIDPRHNEHPPAVVLGFLGYDEAYAAAVDATHAAFPDLVVTVHDQVAEDDKVVTRWSATGTHAGDFAGVPATGRPVAVSGIHIHRVRGGRLIEHWEELNLLGVLRQIGVLS